MVPLFHSGLSWLIMLWLTAWCIFYSFTALDVTFSEWCNILDDNVLTGCLWFHDTDCCISQSWSREDFDSLLFFRSGSSWQWLKLFSFAAGRDILCFALPLATFPDCVPGTLRWDQYSWSCANVATWRFCCDLHGSPIPLHNRMDAWSQRRGLQAVSISRIVLKYVLWYDFAW